MKDSSPTKDNDQGAVFSAAKAKLPETTHGWDKRERDLQWGSRTTTWVELRVGAPGLGCEGSRRAPCDRHRQGSRARRWRKEGDSCEQGSSEEEERRGHLGVARERALDNKYFLSRWEDSRLEFGRLDRRRGSPTAKCHLQEYFSYGSNAYSPLYLTRTSFA